MQTVNINFNQLVKQGKAIPQGSARVRVAVLAEFASQHLVKALRAAAALNKMELEIWETDYDAIDPVVFNESSELYQQSFDYILVYLSAFKLYKAFSYSKQKNQFAEKQLGYIRSIASQLSKTKSRIIVSNYPEMDDAVFGNYASKTSQSFLYQLRKLNLGLMESAQSQKNLFVVDAQSLSAWKGR
ncbi:MAG: hypothetical protein ACJ75B_19210, partial [Flavisolibacter sp.]